MRKREAPCGTATGYRRHYRVGEKPCEPCRIAQRISSGRSRIKHEGAKPDFIEFDESLWLCQMCGYRQICCNVEEARENAGRHQCPLGLTG